MRKRIFGILLAVALIVGVASFVAMTTGAADTVTFKGVDIAYQNAEMKVADNGDLILSFKNTSGESYLKIPEGYTATADLLAVGGGGAGGSVRSSSSTGHSGGGGGGAGEFIERKNITLTPGTYTVFVGAGGVAAPDGNDKVPGDDGKPTSIVLNAGGQNTDYLTAQGGGGGGGEDVGRAGGSGGGGSYGGADAYIGGGASLLEEDGCGHDGGYATKRNAGGGGGAGSVGGDGDDEAGGNGGDGKLSSITGENHYYAGGGGGTTSSSSNVGTGGSGVGGRGGGHTDQDAVAPLAGAANTGSGGGGGGRYKDGAAGGSGIVVFRLTALKRDTDFFRVTNLSETTAATVKWTKNGSPDAISLYYKVGNGDWTAVTGFPANVALPAGGTVFFKNNTGTFNKAVTNSYRLSCDQPHAVAGDVTTLLSTDGSVEDLTDAGTNVFVSLFQEDEKLVSAAELILPSETLTQQCYQAMFNKCKALTAAPELPATTLAESCYQSMFGSCVSLTAAPALPATSLENRCYSEMFYGCKALENAPALPATTLADNCYYGMFDSCEALKNAPTLPALSLTKYCYSNMFRGCIALEQAPALPATTLDEYCYQNMFYGCTALTQAPALPATELASNCYQNMFSGCEALKNAPALPATTLKPNCYDSMFDGCKALTQAPALPAENLANYCYRNMFQECTALTTAPALPAKTLSGTCYYGMFYGCTALTQAPVLPATTLASSCYYQMFYGCTSLTTAPAISSAASKSSSFTSMFKDCTSLERIPFGGTEIKNATGWVQNVRDVGTFISPIRSTTHSSSAIPLSSTKPWTVTAPITVTAAEDAGLTFYYAALKTDGTAEENKKANEQHTVLGLPDEYGDLNHVFGENETVTLTAPAAPEGYYTEVSYRFPGDNRIYVIQPNTDGSFSFTPGKNCTVRVEKKQDLPDYETVSLTVGSDVFLNFYMDISDAAAANGTMVFTVGDRTAEATAQLKDDGRYYFSTPLTALEMSQTVKATFTYQSTNYTETCSVTEYAAQVLAGSYPAAAKALVRKTVNYGHYAQIYLDAIHTGVTLGEGGYPVTAKYTEADIDRTAAKAALTDTYVAPAAANGVSHYGRSAYFGSTTGLNFYVKVESGEEPTVTCENKPVAVELYRDNIYIVTVKDIKAVELNDDFTVTVNGVAFTGSVLDYCAAVLNKNGQTDAAQDAMTAFYEYYLAAVAYAAAE